MTVMPFNQVQSGSPRQAGAPVALRHAPASLGVYVPVERRERLGGLLNFYHRSAA